MLSLLGLLGLLSLLSLLSPSTFPQLSVNAVSTEARCDNMPFLIDILVSQSIPPQALQSHCTYQTSRQTRKAS